MYILGALKYANSTLLFVCIRLGLYHTFEGGCSPSEGDQVADTAAHEKQTEKYPDPNANCWQDRSPSPQLDTCPNDLEGVDPGLGKHVYW